MAEPAIGLVNWADAARCLALDAFAARTSGLLTSAGIDNLLLKGPATAYRLYLDRPDLRTYGDVDLLVRVDRFDAAQDLLRHGGYQWMLSGVRANESAWHEVSWRSPGLADLALDLHRGFAGVGDPSEFFDGLWAAREQFELSGGTVSIPSRSGTALILALHAASPGRGRKPLVDITRGHAVFPLSAWSGAAELARRCGAESACRAGLGLVPGGLQLADELGIRGEVTADLWLGGRQFDRVSVNLAEALGRDRGSRLAFVIRRVVPSPSFLRLADANARRGPGWLLLGYTRRVSRAVVAAPRAAADVLTARRALRPDRPSRSGRLAPQLRRAKRLARWTTLVDGRSIRTAVWTYRSHRSAREHLPAGDVRGIELPPPPSARHLDRRAVLAVLRHRGASCLERSIVLQRFDAGAGRPRTLIIAVTEPGPSFRAHAWLDGEPQPDAALHEILRRPAPEHWVSTDHRAGPGEGGSSIPPLRSVIR